MGTTAENWPRLRSVRSTLTLYNINGGKDGKEIVNNNAMIALFNHIPIQHMFSFGKDKNKTKKSQWRGLSYGGHGTGHGFRVNQYIL